MTRKASLIVLVIQFAVITGMVLIVYHVQSRQIGADQVDAIFTFLGISFVVLSPFGILSAFMSAGFSFMSKTRVLGPQILRRASVPTLEMFFVWIELREKTLINFNEE